MYLKGWRVVVVDFAVSIKFPKILMTFAGVSFALACSGGAKPPPSSTPSQTGCTTQTQQVQQPQSAFPQQTTTGGMATGAAGTQGTVANTGTTGQNTGAGTTGQNTGAGTTGLGLQTQTQQPTGGVTGQTGTTGQTGALPTGTTGNVGTTALPGQTSQIQTASSNTVTDPCASQVPQNPSQFSNQSTNSSGSEFGANSVTSTVTYGANVGNKVLQRSVTACLTEGGFFDRQADFDRLAELSADDLEADDSFKACAREGDCPTYESRLELDCIAADQFRLFQDDPKKCTREDIESYYQNYSQVKTAIANFFNGYSEQKNITVKFDQCIFCEKGSNAEPCLLKRQDGDVVPPNDTIKVFAVIIDTTGGKQTVTKFGSDDFGLLWPDKTQ